MTSSSNLDDYWVYEYGEVFDNTQKQRDIFLKMEEVFSEGVNQRHIVYGTGYLIYL